MQSRKEELKNELQQIRAKELEQELAKSEKLAGNVESIQKVEDAKADRYERQQSAKARRFVMAGDFILKFCIAVAVSVAFIYIIYTGSMASVEEELIGGSTKTSSLFNLLSVVGPLFGYVLSYYFGKNKVSSDGE